MNITSYLTAAGATLGLLTSVPAWAQTKDPSAKKQETPAADPYVKKKEQTPPAADAVLVLETTETYTLSQDQYLSLLEDQASNSSLYDRVRTLETQGKAKLNFLSAVTTKSGQRADLESFDEFVHPSEFTPAAQAQAAPFPTAWEMQPLGDHLEIETVIGPDGLLDDLTIYLENHQLIGVREWRGQAGAKGAPTIDIRDRKITTAAALSHQVPLCLGTLNGTLNYGADASNTPEEATLAFAKVQNLHLHPLGKAKPDDLNLHLSLQLISLERAKAQEILASVTDMEETYQQIAKLLRNKEAKLERVASLVTKSGQRAVLGETTGLRNATEYSTPMVPENPVPPSTEATGKDASVSPKPATPLRGAEISVPTAFETRPLGLTVEAEPVLNETGEMLDVSLSVRYYHYIGNLPAMGFTGEYPDKALFESRLLQTSTTIPLRSHALVGTLNPPRETGLNNRVDDGRVWLAFVLVTAD